MPTPVQKLSSLAYLLRYTGSADLVQVVASLHSPTRLKGAAVRAWPNLRGRPILHTVPSVGDEPIRRDHLVGDATVVVSEHTRRLLREAGVPNVFRVAPPLEVDNLRPRKPKAPETLRRELELGDRAILCPTHYGERSGIPEVVRAFARLQGFAEARGAVLVLACRAHPWQDPKTEERKIRDLAAELGIAKHVRLTGQVADMPALISACAVTALVPDRPGGKMDLPLAILESLALGRPVVVSDRPPISEALLGGGGFAVPYGDVPALADAIFRLLVNPRLREGLADQGRAAVLKYCDPDEVVERYRRIYDQVLRFRRSRNG